MTEKGMLDIMVKGKEEVRFEEVLFLLTTLLKRTNK